MSPYRSTEEQLVQEATRWRRQSDRLTRLLRRRWWERVVLLVAGAAAVGGYMVVGLKFVVNDDLLADCAAENHLADIDVRTWKAQANLETSRADAAEALALSCDQVRHLEVVLGYVLVDADPSGPPRAVVLDTSRMPPTCRYALQVNGLRVACINWP